MAVSTAERGEFQAVGSSRIFESSDTSWSSSLWVIVILRGKAARGFMQQMAERKPLHPAADEIVEDEAPKVGVDNVIGKSYRCACPNCGDDMDIVCRQCGQKSAV